MTLQKLLLHSGSWLNSDATPRNDAAEDVNVSEQSWNAQSCADAMVTARKTACVALSLMVLTMPILV